MPDSTKITYRKSSWWKLNQQRLTPWIFLFPGLLLFLVYVIWPIFNSLYISLLQWDGLSPAIYVGLSNYIELLDDEYFYISLMNNLKWLILFMLAVPIGLGLAIFLNFFELPRSAPLVGGMVLSLMTLPTIIISSRVSMKAVPPSIKEGALGVGASEIQAVFHHVVPVAIPGMLTGTIIGMARALGESAPLLVIGMVAFIVDIPQSVTDPATALPIQIYLWADTPERGFVERTSAAIIVLLIFLILMNSLAVYLRQKFEKDIN